MGADSSRWMAARPYSAIVDWQSSTCSTNAAQPIANEDGSVWLTFNGEIYNFRELRETLEPLGHCFRSHSDSEVIVHAYEEWGEACVSRFRGIFAFGLWDNRNKLLFLARDHLGVKPLYHAQYAGRFTFASQPKAILADPDFPRAIDTHGLRDFFAYGYVPYTRSTFKGISRLPPGHTATLKDGRLTIKSYWQIQCTPAANPPKDAFEEMQAALADAVRSQLVADVPVGIFLSGGIDSSLLVALAKPHLEALRTFTVGFHEAASDERTYARAVSKHFATRHFESVVEFGGLAPKLIEMQEFFDEPFDPTAPIPFLEVSRLARQNGTVVALGGDGADELFAGYLRYDDIDRPGWLPSGRSTRLWSFFRHRGLIGARRPTASDLARYFRYEGCVDAAGIPAILTDSALDKLEDSHEAVMQRFFRPDLPAHLAAQYLDANLFMVDQVLHKVDRAAMAHGVEVRVPFLDPRVVELAFRIPPAQHYRHGERKALLKRIAAQHLPAEVVTPRKKGFSSPLIHWVDLANHAGFHEWMKGSRLMQHGFLRPDWAKRMAAIQGLQGAIGNRACWLILTAELWARRWIEGENLSDSGLPL